MYVRKHCIVIIIQNIIWSKYGVSNEYIVLVELWGTFQTCNITM